MPPGNGRAAAGLPLMAVAAPRRAALVWLGCALIAAATGQDGSCAAVEAPHSDRAAAGSIAGVVGASVPVVCDAGYSGSADAARLHGLSYLPLPFALPFIDRSLPFLALFTVSPRPSGVRPEWLGAHLPAVIAGARKGKTACKGRQVLVPKRRL